MRILLITHHDLAYSPLKSQSRFVTALGEVAETTVVEWEDLSNPSWREAARHAGGANESFDVCLTFVRFRLLNAAPTFDWTGFNGLRAWFDLDAWFNYSPGHRRWNGSFPPAFEKHGFHILLATGRQTTERLRADGVVADWLPKGFADDVFHDVGRDRSGLCTFGNPWPSRRALIHRLRRSGIDIVDVSGPFDTLNPAMNAHLAGLVCNMPGRVPFGRVGRAANRRLPGFSRMWPAVEPMIKTFETAGTGCAPVIDHLDELDELGFRDGRNCLIYHDADEAIELLRNPDPDRLRAIGSAAAELAHSSHTWRHRASRCVELLNLHA